MPQLIPSHFLLGKRPFSSSAYLSADSEKQLGSGSNAPSQSSQGSDLNDQTNQNQVTDTNTQSSMKLGDNTRRDSMDSIGSLSSHESDSTELRTANRTLREKHKENNEEFKTESERYRHKSDSIEFGNEAIDQMNNSLMSQRSMPLSDQDELYKIATEYSEKPQPGKIENTHESVATHVRSHMIDEKFGLGTLAVAAKHYPNIPDDDIRSLSLNKDDTPRDYAERRGILSALYRIATGHAAIKEEAAKIAEKREAERKEREENRPSVSDTQAVGSVNKSQFETSSVSGAQSSEIVSSTKRTADDMNVSETEAKRFKQDSSDVVADSEMPGP